MNKWQPLIIIVILDLVLIGGWLGGRQILSARAEAFATKEQELASLQAGANQAFQLGRQMEDTQGSRLLLLSQFVSKDNTVNFLEDLERWAERMGVSLKVQGVEEKEEISLTLEVIGPFNGVVHFLQVLERAPYQLQITETNFRATEDKEQPESWRGTIKIKLLTHGIKNGN